MYAHPSIAFPPAVRVCLCLSVLAVAACADLRWEKPGMDTVTLERDIEQCTQKARLEARSQEIPRLDGPLVIRADPQGRPVIVPSTTRDSDRFLVEHDFTAVCMRGKGYVLVPADRKKLASDR